MNGDYKIQRAYDKNYYLVSKRKDGMHLKDSSKLL